MARRDETVEELGHIFTTRMRQIYQEMMLRWLTAQRDYPFDGTPEPACPAFLKGERENIIREFQRTI